MNLNNHNRKYLYLQYFGYERVQFILCFFFFFKNKNFPAANSRNKIMDKNIIHNLQGDADPLWIKTPP